MINIEKQLLDARKNLLDLTLNNKLLNFKPTKLQSIKIIDENPADLYKILVIDEKIIKIKPKKVQNNEKNIESNPDANLTNNSLSHNNSIEDSTQYIIRTPLSEEDFRNNLLRIYQKTQAFIEEQGYSILYLALGFLEWSESPNSEYYNKAPLILIPVELERYKVANQYKIKWNNEEIITNVSLQSKLKEQEVDLPDFEMPDNKKGIDNYFESVKMSISNMKGWRVNFDIYLGFFSFKKFVMYMDLNPTLWRADNSLSSNPLLNEIFNPSNNYASYKGFPEEEVDNVLSEKSVYHVVDADPSQIAVIEDVKKGYSMVVEGPPGTGKSQTIVNMIAELIARDKKILFVSEKMAALEVVKQRLDDVGLGDFCLELHSRKTNKKDVIIELKNTIEKCHPQLISENNEFEQLLYYKNELNSYVKALREPFGNLGYTPYKLFNLQEEIKAYYKKVGRLMPRINILNASSASSITEKQINDAVYALTNLSKHLDHVKPLYNNPWKDCDPGIIMPGDEDEIIALIDECKRSLDDLNNNIRHLSQCMSIIKPTNEERAFNAISAAKIILDAKVTDKSLLLNPDWNKQNKQAEQFIKDIVIVQTKKMEILKKFDEKVLDKDLKTIYQDYKNISYSILKIINPKYYKLKKEIKNFYKVSPEINDKKIINDLEKIIDYKNSINQLKQIDESARALFGQLWIAESSNVNELRDFLNWIVLFRQKLLEGIITNDIIEKLSSIVDDKETIKLVEMSEHSLIKFIDARNKLYKKIGANVKIIHGTTIDKVAFSDIDIKLELWKKNTWKISRWSQYISLRNECRKTVAEPILKYVESDYIDPADIIYCFKGNLYDEILRLIYLERPILLNFNGSIHESKIAEFARLDYYLILKNRQRLKNELCQIISNKLNKLKNSDGYKILLKEFNRKRGHMPIRKLLLNAGNIIQDIKPCFMMSPLSIAQFLEPNKIKFDVIIFDEASQVKPEDALGALFRGKQAVIIGDSKQLPPTSFFDNIIEADDEVDDEENVDSLSDIESILHQCKRSFPTKMLRWHYRSKHESLIAVSNQEFYNNRLLIYPSPINQSDGLGLKLVYLPDTVYDRGRSSINRDEAKAVVKAAFDHYKKFPNKSLGVGTFNIKQQQAILDELEIQLQLHPEMEEYFKSDRHEHFFVKNLETIQGDERDVIFISIGFGFDENRKMSLNFGPLNQEGGERRLNVLITRAREKCVVFSNFKAKDLQLKENSSFGLKALKVFLEYAENRVLTSDMPTGGESESEFEESVYEFLKNNGYNVKKQVGCAGFRIDIAIVDPENPGLYLMGIECDGAKYHSCTVARERDRLRQQILVKMGWRIHRVWSTDWYRHRYETEKRLLQAIQDTFKQVHGYEKQSVSMDCLNEEKISPDTINK
ncbi:hypothetical protein Mtc_2303 [Methanocella conradii HZ254]|uniref:RAP domain-containing protein n=1 Tax=Methanocella conradii (strain DSM 24694 / JCM 17849 / CGMCC 1.5162 / HZ254) TaxID=1041930 RepID=H8IB28_METCZ|nr:DUF4011 domain-containing protein [Methanocella conradii]AFD01038.1 hypothetical protein Mtc_2303 [Methanocella conradii HZ254]